MPGSEVHLEDIHRSLNTVLQRHVALALLHQQHGEAAERLGDAEIVRAESPLANFERPFIERLRLVALALRKAVSSKKELSELT